MKAFAAIAALILLSGSAVAQGQQPGQSMKMDMKPMTGPAKTVTGTGMVKNVDVASHRLNLAHDAIPAIDWPAMQMTFAVAPEVDLSSLKAGQAVEFTLVPVGGGIYNIANVKPKS